MHGIFAMGKKALLAAGLLSLAAAGLCAQPGGEPADGSVSVEQARALYSLLENVQGQKSLFPEEVSAENLAPLIEGKFGAENVAVSGQQDEITLFGYLGLRVDAERQFLVMSAYIPAPGGLSADECIRLANEWNQKKIFLIMCYDDGYFRAEYYMTYNGGIHADNLNESLDWFITLVYRFADSLGEN